MDKRTRSVFFDSPKQTLVCIKIHENANPQGVAEHGDDSSSLFLERCVLLLCCFCGSMGVQKISLLPAAMGQS